MDRVGACLLADRNTGREGRGYSITLLTSCSRPPPPSPRLGSLLGFRLRPSTNLRRRFPVPIPLHLSCSHLWSQAHRSVHHIQYLIRQLLWCVGPSEKRAQRPSDALPFSLARRRWYLSFTSTLIFALWRCELSVFQEAQKASPLWISFPH